MICTLSQLDRLIPELQRKLLDDQSAAPPIVSELIALAADRGVKVLPIKPARPVVLPLVLDRIAFIAGEAFGAYRSLPLPSSFAPRLRAPLAEEAFVLEVADELAREDAHIDWNANHHATRTGVVCFTNDGTKVEINVRSVLSALEIGALSD